ncbi:MAG: hypothetical protein R3F37_22750 [Candidatus Competibacteraceae bacterium]
MPAQSGNKAQGRFICPLKTIGQFPCALLDGWKISRWCASTMCSIARRADWELALRNLFERVQGTQGSSHYRHRRARMNWVYLPQLVSRGRLFIAR